MQRYSNQFIESFVGKRVRSFYRARWYGVVLSTERGTCVEVLVTHDRCHRPMRKPIKKILSVGWLEKV